MTSDEPIDITSRVFTHWSLAAPNDRLVEIHTPDGRPMNRRAAEATFWFLRPARFATWADARQEGWRLVSRFYRPTHGAPPDRRWLTVRRTDAPSTPDALDLLAFSSGGSEGGSSPPALWIE